MNEFLPYVDELSQLVNFAIHNPARNQNKVNAAINGDAKKNLYERISVQKRRASGAFFTSHDLAALAADQFASQLKDRSARLFDPACGAGDLLIACTKYVPSERCFGDRLALWSSVFYGTEIHQEFVDAARLRLILAAIARAGQHTSSDVELSQQFFNIRRGDGLHSAKQYAEATGIIMNPPFIKTIAPQELEWANGLVCSSSLFLNDAIEHTSTGTKIVAILPDVIRSGERYKHLRSKVDRLCSVVQVKTLGRFDASTDVHVCILVLKKRSKPRAGNTFWGIQSSKTGTIAETCDVSVGPVVDYRDPHIGPWLSYFCSRDLPKWCEVRREFPKRRFAGRSIQPPFVVVRRNSRPEDECRTVGTIIMGEEPVAVENHLIVVKPKDGRIKTCRILLNKLRDPATTDWLNQRIRCRHLTVEAVKQIPCV